MDPLSAKAAGGGLFNIGGELSKGPATGAKPGSGGKFESVRAEKADPMGKVDRMTQDSVKTRQAYWKMDYSSPDAFVKSVNPNRERLRKIIGAVDPRSSVNRRRPFIAASAARIFGTRMLLHVAMSAMVAGPNAPRCRRTTSSCAASSFGVLRSLAAGAMWRPSCRGATSATS